MVEHEELHIPNDLSIRLNRWHDDIFQNAWPSAHYEDFDYAAAIRQGRDLAMELRMILPASIYLEFNHPREMIVPDGRVQERDTPALILQKCS